MKKNISAFLSSSKYLLAEPHAEALGISESAKELWNQLVLSIYTWDNAYQISDPNLLADLFQRLDKELATSSDSTETIYSLKSNFSVHREAFIGRCELLSQIHNQLSASTAPVFLHGIAGIGKSALAKMYATTYAASYETIIFAKYETSLLDLVIGNEIPIEGLSFQSHGKRGERGRFFRQKINLLKTLMNDRTLLVIDNFDVIKEEHLSDILSLPCKLIITTRTQPQAFGMHGIPVTAFSEQDQRRNLFFLYAPTLSYSEKELMKLDMLLESVHGHTLTIKMIAAYIEKNKLTPGELRIFSTDLQDQLKELFRYSKLTKDERTVLRYLSIMPLDGISITRFAEYCHFTKISVIYRLINQNMIEFDPVREQISLHPLIAQTVRNLEHPDFSNCWPYAQTICEFGRQTWWNTSEKMDEYRQYFYTFMKYVTKPEARKIDDIIYLADGCWQLGNFSLAEKYALSLHSFCLETFGDDHLITARIRHSIGTIYYNCGKNTKAAKWYLLGHDGYCNCTNPDVYFFGILKMKAGRVKRLEKNWTESKYYLQSAISFLQKQLEKSKEENWLILLFDIYSEFIALYLDMHQPDSAWDWCLRYEKEHEALQFGHYSMHWKLYYYIGLCQMQYSDYKKAEYYLDKSLEYVSIYHKKNYLINSMVIDSLLKIVTDSYKRSELQKKLKKVSEQS